MSLPSVSAGLWTYHRTAKWESGLVWDFTEQFRGMALFSTRVTLRFDLLTCNFVTGKSGEERKNVQLTKKIRIPEQRQTIQHSFVTIWHFYSFFPITLSASVLVYCVAALIKKNNLSLGIFWHICATVVVYNYMYISISIYYPGQLYLKTECLPLPQVMSTCITTQTCSSLQPSLLSTHLWNPENWERPFPSNLVASSLSLVGLCCCFFKYSVQFIYSKHLYASFSETGLRWLIA